MRGIREELGGLAVLTDEYRVAARLPRRRFEEDSLNDLVTEVVGFLRPLAEHQGVCLGLDLDPTLPTVAFDRDLLKQALRNLVKNSLEACRTAGESAYARDRTETQW